VQGVDVSVGVAWKAEGMRWGSFSRSRGSSAAVGRDRIAEIDLR
jgi:hypothetical protein